jgi:hypothetical protein
MNYFKIKTYCLVCVHSVYYYKTSILTKSITTGVYAYVC